MIREVSWKIALRTVHLVKGFVPVPLEAMKQVQTVFQINAFLFAATLEK
ncbi:MAG: hypothetical protein HXX20_21085 [Chloroflexi bacterium]|nr:hypothetical protein [Chloroflexota bacterium]